MTNIAPGSRVKKNCNGCKALRLDSSCELGFENKKCKWFRGIVVAMKPLESCPKPMSIKRLIECKSRQYAKKPLDKAESSA